MLSVGEVGRYSLKKQIKQTEMGGYSERMN